MHRRALRARLLLLRYIDGIVLEALPATIGGYQGKVMAGETPANPATMVLDFTIRGIPGWLF
jgi:hypothetical protein